MDSIQSSILSIDQYDCISFKECARSIAIVGHDGSEELIEFIVEYDGFKKITLIFVAIIATEYGCFKGSNVSATIRQGNSDSEAIQTNGQQTS